MPVLGTRGVAITARGRNHSSVTKHAHSLWLSATGDDEDSFYHGVIGPRLSPFLSGAGTVQACEHPQGRA